MPIRATLTMPPVKRLVALFAAYVLVLQALFAPGAQLRVALSRAPVLCTILGLQKPDGTKHALDVCATHCIAQASADGFVWTALVFLVTAFSGWTIIRHQPRRIPPRVAHVFHGRAPPR